MEEKKYYIGDINFGNPVLNASGCWCIDSDQLKELYNSSLSGIVCKTCTIFSRFGNPEPNFYHNKEDNTFFNCKGLPNFGYMYYRTLSTILKDKPFILSLANEEFYKLQLILEDYDNFVSKSVLVEINLSCPNIDSEISGYDPSKIKTLLFNLSNLHLKNIKFGFKLPPYIQLNLIDDIAKIFNYYSDILKYIVLSNSIPNCLPLENGSPVLSKKYGGMSGKHNKYIALSNVVSFFKILNEDISIIGCGGIQTVDDIVDYFKNGAKFVQLASCFYDVESNKLNIDKINNTIKEFMEK